MRSIRSSFILFLLLLLVLGKILTSASSLNPEEAEHNIPEDSIVNISSFSRSLPHISIGGPPGTNTASDDALNCRASTNPDIPPAWDLNQFTDNGNNFKNASDLPPSRPYNGKPVARKLFPDDAPNDRISDPGEDQAEKIKEEILCDEDVASPPMAGELNGGGGENMPRSPTSPSLESSPKKVNGTCPPLRNLLTSNPQNNMPHTPFGFVGALNWDDEESEEETGDSEEEIDQRPIYFQTEETRTFIEKYKEAEQNQSEEQPDEEDESEDDSQNELEEDAPPSHKMKITLPFLPINPSNGDNLLSKNSNSSQKGSQSEDPLKSCKPTDTKLDSQPELSPNHTKGIDNTHPPVVSDNKSDEKNANTDKTSGIADGNDLVSIVEIDEEDENSLYISGNAIISNEETGNNEPLKHITFHPPEKFTAKDSKDNKVEETGKEKYDEPSIAQTCGFNDSKLPDNVFFPTETMPKAEYDKNGFKVPFFPIKPKSHPSKPKDSNQEECQSAANPQYSDSSEDHPPIPSKHIPEKTEKKVPTESGGFSSETLFFFIILCIFLVAAGSFAIFKLRRTFVVASTLVPPTTPLPTTTAEVLRSPDFQVLPAAEFE
jgi:hypothetical protein